MTWDMQASAERKDVDDLKQQIKLRCKPTSHALKFLWRFLGSAEHTEHDELTAIIFADYLYNEVPKLVRDFGYEETPKTGELQP